MAPVPSLKDRVAGTSTTPAVVSYEVVRNDSSDVPSCSTLNLYFKGTGPAAVKSTLNYFEVNISTDCETLCTRINKSDLVAYFKNPENAQSSMYSFDIPLSSLPLGDAGATYLLYINEEFNTADPHKEYDAISFNKSGAPAAPTLSIVAEGSPVQVAAEGGYAKMVGRTGVIYNVSLDQSSGGSPYKTVYLTHIYVKEKVVGSVSSDELTKFTQATTIQQSDMDNKFIRIQVDFPGAKVDSNQSTFVFTENLDGKNSAKSEVKKHTNNARVVIAPNSITSASFNQSEGVSVVLSETFYSGNQPIFYSVLAKKSSASSTGYATTNIINMAFNPADVPSSAIVEDVTQIATGVASPGVAAVAAQPAVPPTSGSAGVPAVLAVARVLAVATFANLTANASYDFILVASSVEIDPTPTVILGRSSAASAEPTLSLPSNVVKGQMLVSVPSPLNTLSNTFNARKIVAPETTNLGGLRITGLSYTETPIPNPAASGNLKSHQCWTLSKVSKDGTKKELASDLTQLSGISSTAALEQLSSFTVVPQELDTDSSYELAVYEALALLPSMISSFPGLKTDASVKLYNRNYYFLLNADSPQAITFKDLVDSNTIDQVYKVAVSPGKDTDGYDFLGVCMSHLPLSNEQLAVAKIRFEVSTSSSFTKTLFISSTSSSSGSSPPPTRILDVNQSADLSEYQRLWIFDDSVAPGTAATSSPQLLCEGAAYYVKVTYIAKQLGFSITVAGSQSSVASTLIRDNSVKLLPGAVSVNATANPTTKKITGSYLLPQSYPTDYALDSARVSLYGSDFVKESPLKTVNLTRRGFTSFPTTFEFDLSNDGELQKDSYNILVTLVLRETTQTNVTTDSTPAHTSVAFSSAVDIQGYEIVANTTPPSGPFTASEIAGKTSLVLRVFLAANNAEEVKVLLPHQGGVFLSLTPVTTANSTFAVWQSGPFNALPTTLTTEPLILAIGVPGAGYDISPPC
jgi:hypothetical protein